MTEPELELPVAALPAVRVAVDLEDAARLDHLRGRERLAREAAPTRAETSAGSHAVAVRPRPTFARARVARARVRRGAGAPPPFAAAARAAAGAAIVATAGRRRRIGEADAPRCAAAARHPRVVGDGACRAPVGRRPRSASRPRQPLRRLVPCCARAVTYPFFLRKLRSARARARGGAGSLVRVRARGTRLSAPRGGGERARARAHAWFGMRTLVNSPRRRPGARPPALSVSLGASTGMPSAPSSARNARAFSWFASCVSPAATRPSRSAARAQVVEAHDMVRALEPPGREPRPPPAAPVREPRRARAAAREYSTQSRLSLWNE